MKNISGNINFTWPLKRDAIAKKEPSAHRPIGPSTISSTECSGNTWVLTQTSFLQVRFEQWFWIWKLDLQRPGWIATSNGTWRTADVHTRFTCITRCEQVLRGQLSVWNNSRLEPTAARHGGYDKKTASINVNAAYRLEFGFKWSNHMNGTETLLPATCLPFFFGTATPKKHWDLCCTLGGLVDPMPLYPSTPMLLHKTVYFFLLVLFFWSLMFWYIAALNGNGCCD